MGSVKKADMSELKKSDILQAVIIADSFHDNFGPLTNDLPKCLFPLANRPLISYTLEFLENSGVQEVFVYVTDFAQMIKTYLKESGWLESSSMSVVAITNEECRSLGDAMRDLDGKGLLRKDFVLLHGDTVSNVDLRPLIEAHKERSITDKNASMTLVYKSVPPSHNGRTTDQEILVVTDSNTNRILHHKRAKGKKVDIPIEIFEENAEVQVRYDLLDPCISICTHAVPPLFADNFDCQELDDFISGVIENDLVDNTIYLAELGDAYASRVFNFYNYQSLSLDVINRWLYPIVPDSSSHSTGNYNYCRHNIYKSDTCSIMRGSCIEKNVVLGPSCVVGQGSKLSNTSIGSNVKIGSHAKLTNCIVLDKVEIGDGCVLNSCIVAESSVIGKNVTINSRSVIGRAVVVGEGVNVPEDTRLVAVRDDSGFSEDEDSGDDESIVAKFGPKAFVFVDDNSDAESNEDGDNVTNTADFWGSKRNDLDSDSESSDDSEFDLNEPAVADIDLDEDAKLSVFSSEIFDSLQRGARENVDSKNLIVEINSSRYAYNANQSNVIHSVITSLLAIATADSNLQGVKLLKEIQKILDQFTPILLIYCKSISAQLDCLHGFEEFCKNNPSIVPVAKNTLHFLYDKDVTSEDAIMKWYQQKESKFPEFGPKLRAKVEPFIDWLNESEEEDD